MNRRIMAKTMSAVTALLMSATLVPTAAFAQDGNSGTDTQSQSDGITLATGDSDAEDIVVEEYSGTQAELKEIEQKNETVYTENYFSSNNVSSGYIDFTKGGSDYGRESLVAFDEENGTEFAQAYDYVLQKAAEFTEKNSADYAVADANNPVYALEVNISAFNLYSIETETVKWQANKLATAILYDAPQLYWLGNAYAYVPNSAEDRATSVLFSINKDFALAADRQAANEAISKAVDKYLELDAYVNDGYTAYQLLETINDALANDVTYNQEAADSHLSSSVSTAHSIYGSLVDHYAVCDGYAKAFQLLSNLAKEKYKLDCDTIEIDGTATNSSGSTGNHAWNAVNLDGVWYYVDVTWDDPTMTDGSDNSIYWKNYFFKGSEDFNKNHTAGETNQSEKTAFFIDYPSVNVSNTEYACNAENGLQVRNIDRVEYYVIKTADDLVKFSNLVYAGGKSEYNARLENDIDMSTKTTDEELEPIGRIYGKPYKGIFDGNGHSISNLNISASESSVGLFGYLDETETTVIKDLTIESGSVVSTYAVTGSMTGVGGIVGKLPSNATIENCVVEKDVSVSATGVAGAGGIVGVLNGGSIDGCENYGSVSANAVTGGIAGFLTSDATVKNVLNNGNIQAKTYTGGIVGFNQSCTLNIENALLMGSTTNIVTNINGTSTLSKCYILGTGTSTDTTTVYTTSDSLASGEVAHDLGWGELLGTDEYPTPTSDDKVCQINYTGAAGGYVYVNKGETLSEVADLDSTTSCWVAMNVNTGDDSYQHSQYYYETVPIYSDYLEMGKVSLLNDNGFLSQYSMTVQKTIEFNICVDFRSSLIKEIASDMYNPTLKVNIAGDDSNYTEISASDTTATWTYTTKSGSSTTSTSIDFIAFPYEVPAKNLSDVISWQLSFDGKTYNSSYSDSKPIYTYLLQLKSQYPEYADIANALLNYGATAQTYKEYNSESLANANLSPDNQNITSVTKNDLTKTFSLVRATNNTTGVKFTGACLDMLTKTQVRVYFTLGSDAKTKLDNGNLYISYIPDGSETPVYVKLSETYTGGQGTFKSVGDEYYFETTGIAPANYAKAMKFEFYTKDSTTGEFVAYDSADTLTYSVYDYFYNKCESESTTGIAKLVSAMYAYSKACSEYIAKHSTTTSN